MDFAAFTVWSFDIVCFRFLTLAEKKMEIVAFQNDCNVKKELYDVHTYTLLLTLDINWL